jgi:4,5-dihydroxyphthalate decarboxylase
MDKLTVAFGDYPHASGLDVAGYRVETVEVRPIIGAYRRMIRDLEFDVCELAPVSYLMAVQAGVPLTAVPVFLNRRFHHGDVRCAVDSGIRVPRDLEGRRVGVRAYTVSTGVWVRGILAEEYGVNVGAITWVVDDEDHIEGRAPANVERVAGGRPLGELLRAGEIDAAFSGNAGTGRAGAPRAGWAAAESGSGPADDGPYPLFSDAEVLGVDHYVRTGVYPLHSVVALRTELVGRDPELPTKLYTALVGAKRRQVAADPGWTTQKRLAEQAAQINGDPVPYGIARNEPTLAALVAYSREQGLLDAGFPADPKALFAAGDYPDA